MGKGSDRKRWDKTGGGKLASDDKELIDHARFLSQQARYPFIHYEHSEIGYNYRMSNVLTATGRGQLKVLDNREWGHGIDRFEDLEAWKKGCCLTVEMLFVFQELQVSRIMIRM